MEEVGHADPGKEPEESEIADRNAEERDKVDPIKSRKPDR